MKMTFKDFVISLFKDERGNISMKPVIALLGVLALIATLLITVIYKKPITVSEALIYALVTIICVAMGTDTMDKYSFKKLIGDQGKVDDKDNVTDAPDVTEVKTV